MTIIILQIKKKKKADCFVWYCAIVVLIVIFILPFPPSNNCSKFVTNIAELLIAVRFLLFFSDIPTVHVVTKMPTFGQKYEKTEHFVS